MEEAGAIQCGSMGQGIPRLFDTLVPLLRPRSFFPGKNIRTYASWEACGSWWPQTSRQLHWERQPDWLCRKRIGRFLLRLVPCTGPGFSLTRICTYERAGYAWSDPGPKPRTFSQLNLELRDAINKLGEQGPFVLVGHSFGGPVVRNFAITYPDKVAGVVSVDAGFVGKNVGIGSQATMRLGDGAKGLSIPLRTRG